MDSAGGLGTKIHSSSRWSQCWEAELSGLPEKWTSLKLTISMLCSWSHTDLSHFYSTKNWIRNIGWV